MVKLVWITPKAEEEIMYCARVSNPSNQDSGDPKLLRYCIKHGHWSIFEMANMCVEITTTRAIAQQILRHKSFSFQEFSQRYSKVQDISVWQARGQHTSRKQCSVDNLSQEVKQWFLEAQFDNNLRAQHMYEQALDKGIAKECARALLPLTTVTKLYMNGTIRSWIHYLQLRLQDDTQMEHRKVAREIREIFTKQLPVVGATALE